VSMIARDLRGKGIGKVGGKMAFTTEKKKGIIEQFRVNEKDCGSSQVQVALLTERIRELTEHFKIHKKGFHSRTGLLVLVARRRKLLDYLKRKDYSQYKKLIAALGLRK